jgi:RNA polymerase sigma-70 factor (ECF subfamily)
MVTTAVRDGRGAARLERGRPQLVEAHADAVSRRDAEAIESDAAAATGGAPRPVQPADLSAESSLAASPEWAPPSWEQVVHDHSARVYRLAYRLTGNPHDAEDLTQEVFVRVFRSLENYTPGTFEGWLHRITTNLFLDQVRRKARVRFDALPDDTERVPGRELSPEDALTTTLLDGDIEEALARLPEDFRVAVVLCDLEGLSYEEIAATLGIKLGTVRSRISRGRAQLRASLANRSRGGAT